MTAKQRCGRKETIVWPPHAPIYTFSALAVGVLVTVFFVWQHLRFSETALQQTYTTTYIGSLTVTLFKQHGNYRLLYVGGGKAASRLALPADFLPGTTILPSGKTVPVTLPTSRSTRATLFSSGTCQELRRCFAQPMAAGHVL